MVTFTSKSGREYDPLPIDSTRGFPQSFPFLFEGQNYHFRLYVNIAASVLNVNDDKTFLELPTETAFLVVQVDKEISDGERETIFVRKVIPELEYVAEKIAIAFPKQKIARNNLNGQGELGSEVIGGIAKRWE
jgi:hypothetical protein